MREGFLESLLLLIQAPFFAAKTAKEIKIAYREVQLDLTPEIEEFHMMFERCHTKKNRRRSIIKYFNFGSSVQLDHPVHSVIHMGLSRLATLAHPLLDSFLQRTPLLLAHACEFEAWLKYQKFGN